jgi:hypothetical protein
MHTAHHVLALGDEIAATGVAPHTEALAELAAAIGDLAPATATVLLDTAAPEILRQRAFAVAAGLMLHRPDRVSVPA